MPDCVTSYPNPTPKFITAYRCLSRERSPQVLPNAPAGLLYPGDPGVPAGLIPTDMKAFAPRLGIAWDPTGNGKLLVTSSYGIFYEPYYTGQGGPLQAPISAPPFLGTPQVSLPDFANPFNGNPPAPGTFSPTLTNLTLSPTLTLPYTQDWDLNLQQSFGSDWLFEIGYVGTKGTRLPRFIEANPAVFVPGYVDGQPISNSSNADQRRLYSGCTLADPPSSCVFSSTGEIAGIANSAYNALEASLRKRFSHGLSFLVVVHVVEGDRRCFVVQHNRIGGEAGRRRKRSRPGSLQSRSRARPLAVRRAQPIRCEL